MSEGFRVNVQVLREAATAAQGVADSLTLPNHEMTGAADLRSTQGGFAFIHALTEVAGGWQEQVAFIGEGYRGAGTNLKAVADEYQRAEDAAKAALTGAPTAKP